MQRALTTLGRVGFIYGVHLKESGDDAWRAECDGAETNYAEALDKVDDLQGLVDAAEMDEMRVRVLFNRAEVAKALGDAATREGMLEKTLRTAQLAGLHHWCSRAMVAQAEALSDRGRLGEATERSEQALEALKKSKRGSEANKPEFVNLLFARTIIQLKCRSFREAKATLKKAKTLDPKNEDILNLERGVSKIIRRLNTLESNTADKGLISKLREELGDLTYKLGLKEIALKYYEEASESAEKSKLSELYFSIGMGSRTVNTANMLKKSRGISSSRGGAGVGTTIPKSAAFPSNLGCTVKDSRLRSGSQEMKAF